MCGNLLKCLKKRKLTPFPGCYLESKLTIGEKGGVVETEVKVYCSYKMLHDEKKRLHYQEWYH